MELLQESKLAQYGKQQNSIKVCENIKYRSLYFQNNVLQSRMDRQYPERLCLSYTEYMMLPLLFEHYTQPQRILIIGVGGGSFIRFFEHYYSSAKIIGIEFSQRVLDIAQEHFLLKTNSQVQLICDCGRSFLENCTEDFDLILIDAFDHKGMAETIYSTPFFALCAEHLTSGGIVSCNTWSGDSRLSENVFDTFKAHFKDSLYCPVPERGNIILLGCKEHVPWGQLHPRNSFLLQQKQRLGIDFTKMITIARRANIPLWKRLFS